MQSKNFAPPNRYSSGCPASERIIVTLSKDNTDKALRTLRDFERAIKSGTVISLTYTGVLATILTDLGMEKINA